MNELVALNNEIRAAYGNRFSGERGLYLPVEANDRTIEELSDELRQRVTEVLELIAQEVPPEFRFQVTLGGEEPWMNVEYDDGPGVIGANMVTPVPWLSVADQLRELDWDRIRDTALSGAAVFNNIVEHSPEQPENVPLTSKLQQKFKQQTESFNSAPLDPDRVHVLQWNEMEGLHEESFESIAGFERSLPDLMTCGYQVVSVRVNGKSLTPTKVDRLKRAALNKLKDMPISYAQASGRLFPPTILHDER